MKAKEIQIGGHYRARISGKFVTVRVDDIVIRPQRRTTPTNKFSPPRTIKKETTYHLTNMDTGRKVYCKSAAKFRRPA